MEKKMVKIFSSTSDPELVEEKVNNWIEKNYNNEIIDIIPTDSQAVADYRTRSRFTLTVLYTRN